MTRNEKYQMIADVVEDYQTLSKQYDELDTALGLGIGGKLYSAVWGSFDKYLKTVQTVLGDTEDDWIGWYIYENGCGEYEYKAGWGEDMFKIKNVDDLIKIMETKPDNDQQITEFKPGKTYKAKIRTWDDMAEEYGVGDFIILRVLTPKRAFTEHMEKAMPLSRIIVFVGNRWNGWVITPEMCEWIEEID